MLEQEFNYTYLSDNIEKHAKPNNTCNVYDLNSYVENTHPILDNIKLKYLDEELQHLMDDLVSFNLLEKDNKKYYVSDHLKQGFPRIMINVKDEELLQLVKHKHEFQYKKVKKFFKDNFNLPKYFHNINDIQVNEIKDNQPNKVAFTRILGKEFDNEDRVMMYGKNKQTLFAALKRQIKTAPIPDSQTVKDFLQYSINIIEKELGDQLNDFGYDISQWFNHLEASKQKLVQPIYDLYHGNYEKLLDYTQEEMKELLTLHYTAIVKSEIEELDGKPRMVCSIPQHIKYIMGPVTWMMEEIASKYLNGYCGGMNLTEMSDKINQYLSEGFVKVVEGDGSAFDNTQDIMLKSIDRYIYNRILPKIYHVDKSLFELVANSYYKIMDVNYRDRYNQKKVRTYLTYYVLGTVFSGDCDTTLMNTIRMVLYNRYVNDKAGLIYGKDYVIFAKGDDFSVLYKNYISDKLINKIYYKYFLPKSEGPDEITDKRQFGLGQVLKYLDIGDASTFKFCSLRSWYINPNEDKITLTRDPKKLFNKSLYSAKFKGYSPIQKYQYHIDQAVSYMVNYKGIEIFEIMAKAHFQQAQKYKEVYNLKLVKKAKSLNQKIKAKLNKKVKLNNIQFTNDDEMNIILSKLFDVKSREKYIDYYTNYWEQTKETELQRTEVNSIEELKYINDQINREFDTEELKSLLALHKKNEY